MGSILLEALKLAPRLFWYSYARPSKAYHFFYQSKRNMTIFRWSCFLSGLVFGVTLAFPHYVLYQTFSQIIAFTFVFVFPFAFAFAFAVNDKILGKNEESEKLFAFVPIIAGIFFLAAGFIFNNKAVISGLFVFLFAFLGAFVGAGAIEGSIGSAINGESDGSIIGKIVIACISATTITILPPSEVINSYKMIIYILSFLIGSVYNSSFSLNKNINRNKEYKKNFRFNIELVEFVTHQKFWKIQKTSLIWGTITSLILFLPFFFNWKPELNEKILIAALGFAVMPVFILRIPDYLLCLPLWFYQRRKILKIDSGSKEIMVAYENSLLFSHEMIYFPLPGLHKIMAAMAGNNEIGIKETVKRINELYWFTFQQKQAQKAILTLGEEKEIAHQYLHILLAEKNYPLVDTLAKASRMAELYLLLFEKASDLKQGKKDNYSIAIAPEKPFFSKPRSKEKQEILQRPLLERIDFVCMEMKKEAGYRFNPEMIQTLELAQKLLTSDGLKNFYTAVDILNITHRYPTEINYFTNFERMVAPLQKIKADLLKIETIERFDTKRSFLSQQKESLKALAKVARDNFYEPFRTLWQEAIDHCAGLVEQEIKLLQGSAVLAIDLKNREILVPAGERNLYFIIHNKGRELADSVTVSLRTGIPLIDFSAFSEAKIDIIEAGTVKEIAFPIAALTAGKTTVQGTITFSDPTREVKKLDFSFPLTLVKKRVEFKEIENPYIVGRPLTGDTPLYFGREDAFAFIDKNITASGSHHTIVCHGLRRTGKSSLLNRIASRGFTDPHLVPIYIDMQGIDDEKDFYATVSGKIREKLTLIPGAPIGTPGDGPSAGPLEGPTGGWAPATAVESFGRFKEFLKEIAPLLGHCSMVLMVDEFEELQMRVEDKRISRTIFSHIRHLMQHEEKLAFLFCGTHKLEEMSADYWSIFFNTALYLRLSRLKDPEAVRLIKEPVKGRLDYDDLAVEQILKMTGGQPYLVQLLCRTLVNALNETKKRNDAVIDDVDEAVEEIINGGTEHFSQQIWDDANLLERLLLSAAAEEMTRRQLDFIGLDTLCTQVEAVAKDYSRKPMLDALEKLVAREILEEKELRYRFPVNLLRKWLAARFPLRKVRA